MLVNKLCLGSVQWGSKYGISNTNGQTSVDEVSKILKDNDFSVLAVENDLTNRPRCIVAKMN